MKYMGSKARYAKDILPIILKGRTENQWYVEPFVGSGNLIAEVSGQRLGSDVNKFLISLHMAIQEGFVPPDKVTEQDYAHFKQLILDCPDEDRPMAAFVGFACSYASKWFGGYARGRNSKGGDRNYALEGKNNCMAYKPKLDGVVFGCCSYDALDIPPNSIIYCDPPYANTTKYKDAFNHVNFWKWCDAMIYKGHSVFVSEYNAPEYWNCVWSKEVFSSLDKNTGGKRGVEKLFHKD